MLQIVALRENLIAGIAHKYFNHVMIVFPQELDPQQFFLDFCQFNPELQQQHPELFDITNPASQEHLTSQLNLARQNFLNSVETLEIPIFYCNYCKKHMVAAEVASHVRSVGHVAAKDDTDNLPSFGCPIVLHGRPMLLDHHVIFPHTMFGCGVMMYDDTIGAMVLPDASQAVTLCPGHEYSLIRFQISSSPKRPRRTSHNTKNDNGGASSFTSRNITLHSETRQNRYFTKDFAAGTQSGGPSDDSFTKFRKVRRLAKLVLELDAGEDFPDSVNAAATTKVGKVRRQMELLKIQDVKNRAGKRRDDRDRTILRFPKNVTNSGSGSIVDRVAGVTALCSVDEQAEHVEAKFQSFRQRLVAKLAREAVLNNNNSNGNMFLNNNNTAKKRKRKNQKKKIRKKKV